MCQLSALKGKFTSIYVLSDFKLLLKMMSFRKSEIDGDYCPEIKSRWKSYSNYRILLWAWMVNEITIMYSPAKISHNGFYMHLALQTLAVIFIGMPLVYSEICLAQYTNCNIFTMWNYFSLFRNVGYGTFYLIILKTLCLLVLTAWYLVYTFYSALNVPPWLSCDDCSDSKCMVKRVNVSIFQHCIEAQMLFDNDCGMQTASNCFFTREIGDKCTKVTYQCFHHWKTIIAIATISSSVYILSIKREKFIQPIVKIVTFYECIVILVLFCVALSTSGTWYATKITVNWSSYNFHNCYSSITRGFLSVGTGYGIILFMSRDVSFRSPATMTAICTSLFSLFVTFMFGLIAFSGIKTMSYYHGEEEKVIEDSSSIFFLMFASMSEIISYFDAMPIWGFFWFSVVFVSLYTIFWILYLFLKELVLNIKIAQKYHNLSCVILMIIIVCFSLPFTCSDLTSALTHAIEIIQIFQSLLFSISLYWIYGYTNHNVDIIFMIGIKANYFWKVAWFMNPILLVTMLYSRWLEMTPTQFDNSYKIEYLNIRLDVLLFYFLFGFYIFIIIVGILTQLVGNRRRGGLWRSIILPTPNWGPRDKILFRSRKMFVPEIMTREFLYRQVRIRGYCKRHRNRSRPNENKHPSEESVCEMTWSALTSN